MKRRTIMNIDADARDRWHQRAQTPGTTEYNRIQQVLSIDLPQWEELEGQSILRILDRPVAALPVTGKKNATKFVVFDINTREVICRLSKSEVGGWLFNEALRAMRQNRRNSVDTHCSECGGQYYSYVCRDCSQPFEYGCYHNRQEFRGRCYNCHEEWKYRDQAMSSAAAELGWTNSPYDADW
mgnify:CR=1 FL=1